MVRLQRKQTNGKVITPSSVNTVAKRIYKETGAMGNVVRIKNRNIITGEHPAPIAVRYGNDVSITNPTALATESQDKKSNRAAMSAERIDYLIEDSGAGMRKDYAQSLFSFTAIHQIYKMFYLMIYCLAVTRNNQGAALYITNTKCCISSIP